MSSFDNNKRIARNTVLLFLRSIIVLAISLYASRLVLKILGAEDYGIYNVVGGFVALFSMFSATFASTTQRFLTFELGKNSEEKVTKVFSASLNIQIIIAFIIVILLETIGLWFLNNRLNIPPERLSIANIVFQSSIVIFVINLIIVPYNASIIAYERMDVFAYISIFEVLLKLGILFIIPILDIDKLFVYAVLMLSISVIVFFTYYIFCKKNFTSCKYIMSSGNGFYKEMLGISGWNFFGSSVSIASIQGIDIILNMFGGGVVVNAAKGITNQVQNAVNQLVNSFTTSLRPQITKSFASEDDYYLNSLIDRGSRYSFYLMAMLSLPILFNTEYLLSLWLEDIPRYAIQFIQISLISQLIYPFSTLLDTLILASGRIRNSQIVLSILQILILPLSYLLLRKGFPPYSVYYTNICLGLISLGTRLIFAHNRFKYLGFSFYIGRVFLRSVSTILLPCVLGIALVCLSTNNIWNFVLRFLILESSFFMCLALWGITKNEKTHIVTILKHKLVR